MTDAIVTQANTTYRDYVVDGVPSSGANKPSKADIRALWAALDAIIGGLSGGGGGGYVGFTTLALLNANLAYPANTLAEVVSDPTGSNDGVYLKSGASGSGSWTQISTLTLSALNSAVAAEVARAEGAEGTLTTNLAAEVARAEAAEAAITAAAAFVEGHVVASGNAGVSDYTARFVDSNGFVQALLGPNGFQVNGALDIGTARFKPSGSPGAYLIDPLGFYSVKLDGYGVEAKSIGVPGALTIRGGQPYASSDLRFVDPLGFVGYALSAHGRLVVGAAAGLDFGMDEISARNARALALTSRTVDLGVPYWLATPSLAYNLVMLYGQSLGTGYEGWPAKTVSGENRSDVLMIGQSVRPGGVDATVTPSPAVDSTIRAAVATVQNSSSGAILSSGAVSALTPGDTAYGEEVSLAATIFCRLLELNDRGLTSDSTRQWFVSNVAVGGQTIEALSKGASPNYYNRLQTMATAIKTAAVASTLGCAAFLWLQGEFNYTTSYGGSTSAATYKTNLLALFANFVADTCVGVLGQSKKPAVIMYQTGASFTLDTADMSIGEAQWELCRDNPGWFMAAPAYPVTDKGGHLDANGYRWLACQFGKVMHQTLVLRKNWRPLSPISVEARGLTVLVGFHVPCPPIQFQAAYEVSAAVMRQTRGFRVYDTVGEVPISGVEIVGEAALAISLTRALVGAASLYAGRQEDNGSVDLCDSDPTVAPFNYEYASGSGDYAAANVAALAGAPYPLWNWCVAFKQPITVVS